MRIEHAFCDTEHGAVYCWSIGQGPALLLLHQASQTSAETKAVAVKLAASFRVIGFDYPGHGQSEDPDREPAVADYGRAALAVLDHYGAESAHVCGHHSGGVLAIHLAAEYGERIATATVAGVGIRDEETVNTVLTTPMTRDLPVDADGDFLQRTWEVYRRMSAPGVSPQATFEFFREGLCARTRPYDAHFAFLRWDWNAAAAKLDQETLLVYGEHDHFVERPDELAARIKRCRVRTIPDGGAFMFYEQPASCAREIVAFIESAAL